MVTLIESALMRSSVKSSEVRARAAIVSAFSAKPGMPCARMAGRCI